MTNWHRLGPEPEEVKVGKATVTRLGPETPEAFARNRLGDLWDDEPLMVLNDEGHHAYRPAPVDKKIKLSTDMKADRDEATVWVDGLDTINAACGIELCVDLSATPFYHPGQRLPRGLALPVDRQRLQPGRRHRERHHEDPAPARHRQHRPARPEVLPPVAPRRRGPARRRKADRRPAEARGRLPQGRGRPRHPRRRVEGEARAGARRHPRPGPHAARAHRRLRQHRRGHPRAPH